MIDRLFIGASPVSTLVSTLTLALALAPTFMCSGCADKAGAPRGQGPLAGDMGEAAMAMDASPMVPEMDEPDAGASVPAPEPTHIEVKLDPRPRTPSTVYNLDDHPQVEVTVYGPDGEVIPDHPVVLDVVDPNGDSELGPPARLSEDRALTFLREGPGAVRARLPGQGCSTAMDLCGRANFFVDEAPPVLEIISPARGAIVEGSTEDGVHPTITVQGRTDADGQTRVFVNDVEAAISGDGTFSADVPARFGLNRIDVVADDGVRRPPVRAIRDVIWAETIHPPSDDGYDVPSAMMLRLGQYAFDGGADVPEPEADGTLEVGDVAALVEALLSRADLIGVLRESLPGGQVEDSGDFSLTIGDITPGQPDIAVAFTDTGLEVFIRIEGMVVSTSGRLDQYSLDGEITLSIAAVVQFDFSGQTGDDGLYDILISAAESPENVATGSRCPEVALAIEALEPRMEDPAVNGLLGVLSNPARALVEGSVEDVVCDLLRERLPEFFDLGLDDAFESVRNSHVGTDADEFLPATALNVSLILTQHEVTANTSLSLIFDGGIRPEVAREAPHPSPGVPSHDYERNPEPLWPPNSDGAVAMKLSILNGVVESLWRQGILDLQIEGDAAAELPGIRSVHLDGRLPPVVAPTPLGSPYPLELQIGGLELAMKSVLDGPDVPPDLYSLSLRAGLAFDLERGGVTVGIAEDVDARFEVTEVGGDRVFLDTGTLGTLFNAAIWPELRSGLGELLGIRVSPIRIDAESIARLTDGVETIEVRPEFPYPAVVNQGWLIINSEVVYRMR